MIAAVFIQWPSRQAKDLFKLILPSKPFLQQNPCDVAQLRFTHGPSEVQGTHLAAWKRRAKARENPLPSCGCLIYRGCGRRIAYPL
jgi:hypothetical protein